MNSDPIQPSSTPLEQTRLGKALTALKKVASVLGQTGNLTVLTQGALARTVDTMAWDAGAVYLRDHTGRITCLAKRNRQEGIVTWKTQLARGGRAARQLADSVEPTHLDRETWEEQDLPFHRWSVDVQSLLLIPLQARDVLIGILYLVATCPLELDPAEMDVLSILGHQIATAVLLGRLQAGESRARRVAGRLRDVAQTISSGLNLDQVLALILERLGDVVPFDSASVMLVSDGSFDVLFAQDRDGEKKRIDVGLPSEHRAAAWQVVNNGEPILLTDVTDSPFWTEVPQLDYIRCWIGVPLKVRDEVIGVLTLDKAEPGFYQPAQVPVLSAFASQAAAAIENARLYDAAQQTLTERTMLYEVSRAVSSSLEFDAVLNAVIDAAIQATGAERGYLVLRDGSPSELTFLVARDSARETIKGDELIVSRSIAWRVLETGEPVLTVNAQEDPRFAEASSVISYSLRSVLCVPLVSKTQVIGTLYVDNRLRDGQFTSHSLEMLNNIAAQAAAAVENALLYNQLREANAKLTVALEESRRSYEQLKVAHELNQPLTVIQSLSAQLLERDVEDETLRQDLAEIARASQQATEIVQEMAKATRYETRTHAGGQRIVDPDQAAVDGYAKENKAE
jgi:GAF domain-containing protein